MYYFVKNKMISSLSNGTQDSLMAVTTIKISLGYCL